MSTTTNLGLYYPADHDTSFKDFWEKTSQTNLQILDDLSYARGPYGAIVYLEGSEVVAEDAKGHNITSGDVGTDDVTVINAAINAIYNSGKRGTVKLDAGIFSVPTPILWKPSVDIEGSGASEHGTLGTKPYGTVLKATAATDVIQASALSYAKLSDLEIDGNSVGLRGVEILPVGSDANSVINMERVRIGHLTGSALHLDNVTNSRFTDLELMYNDKGIETAYSLELTYNDNNIFDRIFSANNTYDYLYACNFIELRNCTFIRKTNTECSLKMRAVKSSSLHCCHFEDITNTVDYSLEIMVSSGNIGLYNTYFYNASHHPNVAQVYLFSWAGGAEAITGVAFHGCRFEDSTVPNIKTDYYNPGDVKDFGLYDCYLAYGILNTAFAQISSKNNTGYVAPGEIRTHSGSIATLTENAFNSLDNPFGDDVALLSLDIRVVTKATATSPNIDCGIGSSATADYTTLFDDLPGETTGFYKSTISTPGTQTVPQLWQTGAGNRYLNLSIKDAAATGMVATYIATVMGL